MLLVAAAGLDTYTHMQRRSYVSCNTLPPLKSLLGNAGRLCWKPGKETYRERDVHSGLSYTFHIFFYAGQRRDCARLIFEHAWRCIKNAEGFKMYARSSRWSEFVPATPNRQFSDGSRCMQCMPDTWRLHLLRFKVAYDSHLPPQSPPASFDRRP
jgi:hypothetical protein